MPKKATTQKRTSNKRTQNRRRKEKYWTQQINAYRASGLSAKKWCEDNQVNVHTLTVWITRLNLQQNKTANSGLLSSVPYSEQSFNPESSDNQQDNLTDPSKEVEAEQIASPATPSIDVPDISIKADVQTIDLTGSPADGAPNRPTVVIRHGAITITAQENYDKATLMALVDVLLGRDTTDTTTLNRE